MSTYDFLGIHIDSGGGGDDIQIVSTDEDVIKWFTEKIQSLSQTVQIYEAETNPFYQKWPQAQNLIRAFRKMDYQQYSIGMLLIMELCHNGWEPFGSTSFSRSIERITLRRCRE